MKFILITFIITAPMHFVQVNVLVDFVIFYFSINEHERHDHA